MDQYPRARAAAKLSVFRTRLQEARLGIGTPLTNQEVAHLLTDAYRLLHQYIPEYAYTWSFLVLVSRATLLLKAPQVLEAAVLSIRTDTGKQTLVWWQRAWLCVWRFFKRVKV